MYKITKKYTDFNGVEKEEDFYFHLSKADILKMELSEEGGMAVLPIPGLFDGADEV